MGIVIFAVMKKKSDPVEKIVRVITVIAILAALGWIIKKTAIGISNITRWMWGKISKNKSSSQPIAQASAKIHPVEISQESDADRINREFQLAKFK